MLDQRQQMNIPPVLLDDSGNPMSFYDILMDQGLTIAGFAKCVGVSRQCVYKYINGQVNPERIPYNVVTVWCQYLRLGDMQLYNAMVESFESVHVFKEKSGKWE